MKTISFFFVAFFTLCAQAQFVEEIATLESLYESRARAVLNSFLRPHEYSIIISADIDQDEKKLDEYREKMELQYLPGLPIPADPSLTPATNDLHSMKTKITIDLVLNSDVPPEKEELLKGILKSKLHLEESNGDTIQVSRASFPDLNQKPEPPKILPEFSWKTWSLIVLLSLVLLAAVIFWVSSRKARNQKEKEKEEDQTKMEKEKDEHEKSADLNVDHKKYEENLPQIAAEDGRHKVNSDPGRELSELKDQILFFASQYQNISSKSVMEMIEAKEEEYVLLTFEYISWEVARRLFSQVNQKTWTRLASLLRQFSKEPTEQDFLIALHRVYQSFLSKFLESGAEKDEVNPFAFIFMLSKHDRHRLLKDEAISNIAVISLYAEGENLEKLLEATSKETQEKMIMEVARFQVLPESTLTSITTSLHEKLKFIKASPSIATDGPAMAVKMLRTYSAEKELEMLEKMQKENPASFESIRRSLVIFNDLQLYPKHVIEVALTLQEVESIAFALKDSTAESRSHFLSLMPVKRARMVERDFENISSAVRPSVFAQAKRDFCRQVENVLSAKGLSMNDIWTEMDVNAQEPIQKAS